MGIWYEILECMVLYKFVDIPPTYVAGLHTYVTEIKKIVPEIY